MSFTSATESWREDCGSGYIPECALTIYLAIYLGMIAVLSEEVPQTSVSLLLAYLKNNPGLSQSHTSTTNYQTQHERCWTFHQYSSVILR